jgi:hypothetical protein
MTADDVSTLRRRSLRGLGVALLVAVVLLLTVVMPAEFGRDPTGVGRLLGLTAMRSPETAPATVQLTDVIGGNEQVISVDPGDGREPVPLPNPAVYQSETVAPRSETLTVSLGLDEKTEIKALLGKGKVITYSWSVEGGQVYVDFHGHDPSLGEKFWVRYQEADGIASSNGSLVAPFSGEHGWYWLNVSDGPVTITLTVTGYHSGLKDYGRLE